MDRPKTPESMAKQEKHRKEKYGKNTVPKYLGEVVNDFTGSLSPPPDHPTQDGQTSSDTRRTLNPRFVEWMHGWPVGLTSCELRVTGFQAWLLRSRGELSKILSPRGIETALF
jgi:hypothetical protein